MFKYNSFSRQASVFSDFKKADECNTFDLKYPTKTCAYDLKAGECKEIYQSCSSYNTDVNSPDRKNETCYSIAVYDTSTKEIDYSQVCLIEKDDDTKTCN